jgi:hypothetical protein
VQVRAGAAFETKRAAEAHIRALTDGRVGTAGETLAEFLEEMWLPAKEGRVEVATFDQYSWAVRRHIVPLLGAVRLRDLSAEVVDAWIAELRAETEAGPLASGRRRPPTFERSCRWRWRRPSSGAGCRRTRWR